MPMLNPALSQKPSEGTNSSLGPKPLTLPLPSQPPAPPLSSSGHPWPNEGAVPAAPAAGCMPPAVTSSSVLSPDEKAVAEALLSGSVLGFDAHSPCQPLGRARAAPCTPASRLWEAQPARRLWDQPPRSRSAPLPRSLLGHEPLV